MQMEHELEIKFVVVGDGSVGKTSMLMSYSKNHFPLDYVPTVFDNYTTDILVDGRCVRLSLWDTAGQEDYDRLRPLSYSNVDLFLVCFSLDNPVSLNNVSTKWGPDLKRYARRVPTILVGLKKDLRDGDGNTGGGGATRQQQGTFVSYDEGREKAAEISSLRYLECSAKTQDGLHDVFNEAIRAVVLPPSSLSKIGNACCFCSKKCNIL